MDVEVLRSEFDAHGYDLVMARRRVVRHIQFKTGTSKKPGDVSVSLTLAGKPSGCIIWIRVSDALDMGPYFWFGADPGEPLPPIEAYEIPLRATHNKDGERPPRTNHCLVPRAAFTAIEKLEDVLVRLLGEFRYEVKRCVPDDLSGAELDAAAAIVADGGAVHGDIRRNLGTATPMAVVRCLGTIVGVGAIKARREQYTAKISGRSQSELARTTPELGYVAVVPAYQRNGLSERIVNALLAGRDGPLFATTDDGGMKNTLTRAGFT